MNAAQRTVTVLPNGDPTTCHVCSRHAVGVGLGLTSRTDKDPRYLCGECVLLIERIREVRRFDPYELKALESVDEIAGEYCGSLGQTDMAEMSEEERRLLWRTVVQGFGDGLRRLISEGSAPF